MSEKQLSDEYLCGFNAAKEKAVAWVNKCREEGESDLRSVRANIQYMTPTSKVRFDDDEDDKA